jgi:hypothetical protein
MIFMPRRPEVAFERTGAAAPRRSSTPRAAQWLVVVAGSG